ncbi:hypothetical protein COLO4_07669 [Corchorus olitorius]|uniref:MLLE-like domain-containing protein n=1 Tax=Corchorus olitorius TaxID=93759 RepID=A0A1R3KIY1_9ROSI|nr:hypothetical protein COLO4_07669 [Corchorus olitorius]
MEISNDTKWRADNGTFRTGYLAELERKMHARIPGTDVKGQPHISSRIKLWKRQYGEILKMMGDKGSGLGWHEQDKCIRCESDVWESWVQGHLQAKGIRGKAFPYLDEWGVIFGKDRATGENAEGPANVADDPHLDGPAVGLGEDGETNYYEAPEVPAEEDEEEGDGGESTQPTQTPAAPAETQHSQPSNVHSLGARRQKRRRSFTDQVGDVAEGDSTVTHIDRVLEGSSHCIQNLANCFQFLAHQHEAQERVFTEVQKVEGLTRAAMLKAGDILSQDSHKMQYFMTLPEDFKKEYIDMLLS